MRPATVILVYCAISCACLMIGIAFGAKWERETSELVKTGLLCVCKP
jgi:hypothetical protein